MKKGEKGWRDKETVEAEKCPRYSVHQLLGPFDGGNIHEIVGSDSIVFKKTLDNNRVAGIMGFQFA